MEEYTVKRTMHNEREGYSQGIIEIDSNDHEKVFVLNQRKLVRTVLRLTYECKHEQPVIIAADIIYQKKVAKHLWEDDCHKKLTSVKSGESIKHSLAPSILSNLSDLLLTLPTIASEMNDIGPPQGANPAYKLIKPGTKKWQGAELAEAIEMLDSQGGIDALKGVANWLNKNSGLDLTKLHLSESEHDKFRELGEQSNIELLSQSFNYWLENKECSIEEEWQKYFSERPYILHSAYPSPAMLIQEKAYIGGKSIDRNGGNEVDYLLSNPISGNLVLIELKTPKTKLIGKLYRNNTYNISGELAGAVQQSLNYLHKTRESYQFLKSQSHESSVINSNCFHPKVMLIVGNSENLPEDQLRSFELFRNSINDVEIITFNELFDKVKILYDSLKTPDSSICEEEFDSFEPDDYFDF